jgi:hypothetical protein
LRKKKNIEN